MTTTGVYMTKDNLNAALSYYQAMAEKNIAKLECYLDTDVTLISPLSKVLGKVAVIEAAKGFVNIFNSLNIRASFSNGNQVMLAVDLNCPEPLGTFKTAVMMTFKDKLIIESELFYDTRVFLKSLQ